MDSVFDFLSDSLNLQAPSSPISSERPAFLRKSLTHGDPLVEGQNRLVSPQSSAYPLTPLESRIKDIIVNIYGDNPSVPLTGKEETLVSKSVDHTPEKEESLDHQHQSTDHCVSIPKHLLSTVKRPVPREKRNMSENMSSKALDPPIFSADDIPLSPSSNFPPVQEPASSSLLQGESNEPLALRSSLLLNDEKPHKNLPQSAFSPSDLPLDVKPSFSSLHSAFSMPGPLPEKRHPGYPLRVQDSALLTTSVPQSLSLPLEDTTDNFDSQSIKSEPVEKLVDSNPTTPTPLNAFNSRLSQSSTCVNQKPEIPKHIKIGQHILKQEEKSKLPNDTSVVMPESSTWSPSVAEMKLDETPSSPKKNYPSNSLLNPLPQDDRNTASKLGKAQPMPSVDLPKVVAKASTGSVKRTKTSLSTATLDPTTAPTTPLVPGRVCTTQPSETNSSDLEKQLHQLRKEKANLEGQLESVVKECQNTLSDRARLQSKLSKAEAQIQMVQKEASALKPDLVRKPATEEGTDLMVEINRLESALRKRRQEMAVMTKEMKQHKEQVERMSKELIQSKESLEAKDAEMRNLSSTTAGLKEENEEKADTIHEFSSCIANLKANMETTESAKAWLHDQLQEAIQSKLKLQDELRGLRASSIAHTVRTDQLERENRLLKQQLGELQNKVLKDKAGLVSELEAIEADVLSKESTYAELESTKEHLEQLLELRNEQMKKLESNVVQQQAQLTELEGKLADDNRSTELFASQLKKLEDENTRLNNAVQHQKQTTENKDRELAELKKAKVSLQQRLQQAEALLITKEGTLQGLKDSQEIMRQELEGVKAARECSDTELAKAQENLVELESQLESAEIKLRQNAVELLQVKHKLHNNQGTIDVMKSQLSSKEKELDEKKSELVSLEDHSADLIDQFQSIQSQFHSIADESGLGMAEKNRIIDHLIEEKDHQGQELDGLKSECEQLKSSLNQLEVKNAHLQGELDSLIATAPKAEDIKRILQEKNAVESQMGLERIRHQQEMIKNQAKIARLETELNDGKREEKRKEKKVKEELDALRRDLEAREHIKNQDDDKVAEDVLHELSSLRSQLTEKENDIQTLIDQQGILEEENFNFKQQLEEESAHTAEVERASGIVALQLKQSALEKERKMKEEIQGLVVENERLKGRLAGTDTAQMCLREHANALENCLAEKEAQLTQLSSKNASLLSEKEMEIEDLKCRIENLQDSLGDLKAELEKVLTDGLLEKQRADDLERSLKDKEAELSHAQAAHVDSEREALMEQLEELEKRNEDLQAEMRTMKQQLGVSQTSHNSTKRELQEKAALADILEKNLQLAQDQLAQTQEELSVIKDHAKSTGERHKQEVDALRQILPAFQQISQSVDATDTAGVYDEVMSVSSTDEAAMHLQDENSLYKAQLQEVEGRLVKARKEGQEAAEKKSVGEIKSLRTQLGAKSKTLKTLQDCVSSLKDDMNSMQSHMSVHSSSLAHSYRSSREIESKIEGLRRNQSGSASPYPVASTPTKFV